MADVTGISWTHHTWNPVEGCHKVSEGCRHCYMFEQLRRYGRDPNTPRRTQTWDQPYRWERRARETGVPELVFACSLSDWFVEEIDRWRDDLWEIIRDCPHLIFQILTKRPRRIQDHLPADWGGGYANVWLGVSIENEDSLWRADVLRQVPARVRFISAEPLLGPLPGLDLTGIHWLIVGGETGPGFRPMDPAWARQLRDKARAAGTAFFFKQSSDRYPGRGDQLDGLEWKQFPEFPPGPQTSANWAAFRARRAEELRQAEGRRAGEEAAREREKRRQEQERLRAEREAAKVREQAEQHQAEERRRAEELRLQECVRPARERAERRHQPLRDGQEHRGQYAEVRQGPVEPEEHRPKREHYGDRLDEIAEDLLRVAEESRAAVEDIQRWLEKAAYRRKMGILEQVFMAPHLAVLGLQWPCTREEVKKAYWAAAKEHHPDRFGDPERFKKAREAYDYTLGALDRLGVR
jgi:protein gp37